jgi:hypothetical protein
MLGVWIEEEAVLFIIVAVSWGGEEVPIRAHGTVSLDALAAI